MGPWLRVVRCDFCSQNSKVGHETMKLVSPKMHLFASDDVLTNNQDNHVDVERRSADMCKDHRAVSPVLPDHYTSSLHTGQEDQL